MDRAADLGRDEFPRSENHAYDVINMEENRLIDRHTKHKGKFNNEGTSKLTSGAIFSQVGNMSAEKKNQSVKNNNR